MGKKNKRKNQICDVVVLSVLWKRTMATQASSREEVFITKIKQRVLVLS